MKLSQLTRRKFLSRALKSAGTAVTSTGIAIHLSACESRAKNAGTSGEAQFDFGVASGDPLHDRVILWTRVTPAKHTSSAKSLEPIWVEWQVARDDTFNNLVIADATTTDSSRDYTLKIDAQGLEPDTHYYYRFISGNTVSPIGRTKTLPTGNVEHINFAVVSCANYPAGLFHVYGEIAKAEDIDAVLHLGDYIYEYGRGVLASDNAAALGREVLPPKELSDLEDYRSRYAQYRSDVNLQAAHASAPFIAVWDDHEIANDTWREGAENHNEYQGEFDLRLEAALQAYAEWMPIRPSVNEEIASLQRNFEFGNLVNLIMLDTRVVGRDQQLNLSDYIDINGDFDAVRYEADISNPARTILGSDQRAWLQAQLTNSNTWQVLGQQVLMGNMHLPTAITTGRMSVSQFAELVAIAQAAESTPESLTPEQQQFLQNNAGLLQLGSLPFNLDAWDGYPIERAQVLESSIQAGNNLVVLAGDTHNAWANNLQLGDTPAGVEFSTPSISSPGLEALFGLSSQTDIQQTESTLTQFIEQLCYTNLSNRGFLLLHFTAQAVTATWKYVSTVTSHQYSMLDSRSYSLTVAVNSNQIV